VRPKKATPKTSALEKARAISGSLALHAAIVVALTVGVHFSGTPRQRASQPLAIEATVVDEAAVRQEMARLGEQERREVTRRQEEERQAREAAEAARRARDEEQRKLATEQREREEVAARERARLADLQQQREAEQRRAEQERQRREQAERERRAEEERLAKLKQEEEQQRRAEEQRKREAAAAARQKAELEAELQRQVAAEEERQSAERAGLLDEYIRLIENRIEQNWIAPATAKPGLECVVNVTQIPSGDIVDVRVGRCNGDDAVVRSIEAAVLKASPLPKPPNPALFERNLIVTFRPDV
jgi:colicin import membrane protein